jgi:enoyl-CoA hydratase/carnithine racemase
MNSSLLIREEVNGVAILRLSHGVTNALDIGLVEELSLTLKTIRNDSSQGLVITGENDKFFSIGFDIPSLLTLSREDFSSFYRGYNRLCLELFTLPKPCLAGINGHAIAGGCILALACDYRFIAEGRKLIGLNEVKLGVPVPYIADRIVHALLGGRYAREVLEIGDFYLSEQAFEIGLVDEIFHPDELLTRSVERVTNLAASPGGAFPSIKANRVEPIVDEIQSKLDEKAEHFINCWYSQPARHALEEATAKF